MTARHIMVFRPAAYLVCLFGLVTSNAASCEQNIPAKDTGVLLGADRAGSAPQPFRLFASGRLEAGENRHWKLKLPGGRLEFLADVRRVDRLPKGVSGELEIIRSEDAEGEDSVLSSKFKEQAIGWRVALNLETTPQSPAVLQLVNHSNEEVDYWVYVLRPTTAKVPPIYGDIIPPLVLPTTLPKFTIRPGETNFFRLRLPKGKSIIYGDFLRLGIPGQSIQAEVRFQGPHGEPVEKQPIMLDQDTSAHRAAFAREYNQPVYAIASVTNRGTCDFACQLSLPASTTASVLSPKSPPEPKTQLIHDPITANIAANQKFTRILSPGGVVLLKFQAAKGIAKITLNVAGNLMGSGRLTVLDEHKLTTPTQPVSISPDAEPRFVAIPLTFTDSGDVYLKLENTGKVETSFGILIETDE